MENQVYINSPQSYQFQTPTSYLSILVHHHIFKFVKIHQKVHNFGGGKAKTGQNYAFSLLRSTSAQKKYTPDSCVVVINISYVPTF